MIGGVAPGGFSRLPGGTVVVALTLPRPGADEGDGTIRVLVHAANRQRALTRMRNLGFRTVRLAGNAEPPTPDEISVVLHHPDGLVWRPHHADPAGPWQPLSALRRAGPHHR
jgi:hypothetical protein